MLHLYTTEIVTKNQADYDSFIHSFLPFLSQIHCPKCHASSSLILYGTYPRSFIHSDLSRTSLRVQRVQCTHCGSTHVLLPTTVLPFFLHVLFNIQDAVHSSSDMEITYIDYLKRRFRFVRFDRLSFFHSFFMILRSIPRFRSIFYGFFAKPTYLL